ncbi:MAG: formate dehydrogenase accessory sulfurtransferase FdhD [Acidobacteria bacterium]|nr:formate dehydrogenase accessory sulfurtransferase FdhD [Acidobacteriota bacterium]MCA1610382.1 formate dehydrogenase accessory sulfurtransferase FdhD [Acidobacteriota bacterium]
MPSIDRVRVVARDGPSEVEREDSVAVEEPLEIRLRPPRVSKAEPFVTTMRTPGHDEELAAGLLFAEGVLLTRSDLTDLSRPSDPRIDPELRANVLVATVSPEAIGRSESLRRRTVMGSACGVCGKTSIENVLSSDRPPISSSFRLDPAVLVRLPDLLRADQSVFSQTGGLHGAGLFDASGVLEILREDIGRHNAVDKVVGAAWLGSRLPLSDRVLVVSGRAGFEIAQKAAAAGIPVLASVSAPSSLAVEFSDAAGLTLVGFLRGLRFNVYAHPNRIGAGR